MEVWVAGVSTSGLSNFRPLTGRIKLPVIHHQIATCLVMASSDIYCILTHDRNKNRHAGDLVQHRDFSSVRLATGGVTYPQRCFRHSISRGPSTCILLESYLRPAGCVLKVKLSL
jgi:hypothetical protein